MRSLIRRLEEAAPAPGSKEWLAGVKKWWGQWVKDAERVAKIRDPQDRKVVLNWFTDGENRIRLLIDVLVRRSWLQTDPSLAKITVGSKEYKDGIARMKVPRSYTVDGNKVRPEPGELVHPHLDAALRSLENVMSMEQYGWEDSKKPDMERRWGTTKDLDAWQVRVELFPNDIKGVDIDVQAAFRKYAADVKDTSTQERIIADSIPLDYDLGGVKVITDPGALHSLGMLTVPGVELGASRVSNRTMNMIKDGLEIGYRVLKQRGFGNVWYGTIFVLPPSKAIMGTTNKTGRKFQAAGHYNMSDSIVVNPEASWKAENVTRVIVHELGHRYWYKHMKAGARARFAAWFDPRTKADQEREGAKSEYVPAPTAYGSESPVEEFAETFAAYVLGKYEGITLTGPQKARFEALALGRAAQSEDVEEALGKTSHDVADAAYWLPDGVVTPPRGGRARSIP